MCPAFGERTGLDVTGPLVEYRKPVYSVRGRVCRPLGPGTASFPQITLSEGDGIENVQCTVPFAANAQELYVI